MLGNDGELGDEGLEPVLGGVGDQPDNLGRRRLQALLNIELDLQKKKFIWASCVQLHSLAETPQPPSLYPAFGLIYEGAIGQQT